MKLINVISARRIPKARIIKKFSALYFADIMGFCVMGNPFHLLVKVRPDHDFTDE
jgi:putative transposase